MADIYDKATGQVVGQTGSVPGAVYRNGFIVGFQGPTTTLTKPATSPPAPFRQTSSVAGTEDVRGLPYGSTSTNRAATTPTQPQTGTSPQPFNVQAAIDKAVAAALAAAAPQGPQIPVTDEQARKWIFDHYGYMAAYLNHPEVGPILLKAARLGITGESELFGMLSATNWWKTTASSARQWDLLVSTDPATADAQRQARQAEINNRASSLGIELGGDMGSFVEQSLRQGWSADQVVDYLIQRVEGQTRYTQGDLAAIQSQVRANATNYLIDASDETTSWYARRIASGELTYEAANAVFAQQAQARFGWMGDALQKGLTPMDYFRPMIDRAARIMEVNPSDVDPMDPKWLSVLETTDSRTGERRGATDYEMQRTLRTQSGWYDTNSAQDLYAGLSMSLASKFGMV